MSMSVKHTVVKDEAVVTVLVQQLLSMVGAKVLKLQHAIRPAGCHRAHKLCGRCAQVVYQERPQEESGKQTWYVVM